MKKVQRKDRSAQGAFCSRNKERFLENELEMGAGMGKKIRKVGKFYSSVIMGNIGIFMFIGLVSVIFNKNGWLPKEEIYNISQLVYYVVLPICIAFVGGERIGGQMGGILAVLAVAGMLAADTSVGLLAGMAAGPVSGLFWKHTWAILERKMPSSLQMLTRNLSAGIFGGILAILGFYFVTPVLMIAEGVISLLIKCLLDRNLVGLLNLVIEPAKVFFLNNVMNHGILVPIAMSETEKMGNSVLFLLEANPGPGLGMLAALWFYERKEKYLSALAAHGIGGIHEVYFPFVLANLWLLLPLIAAGMAGAWWFDIFEAGLKAPVSPGSIFIILLMAGKGNTLVILLGILLSAGVSFSGCLLTLKWRKKRGKAEHMEEGKEKSVETTENLEVAKMPIHKIGFVCDAGVGSSAMGAAIFRRKLHQNKIEGIHVEAFAADMLPEDLDLIVSQKDFYHLLPEKAKETDLFLVDNFVSAQAYDELVKIVAERR